MIRTFSFYGILLFFLSIFASGKASGRFSYPEEVLSIQKNDTSRKKRGRYYHIYGRRVFLTRDSVRVLKQNSPSARTSLTFGILSVGFGASWFLAVIAPIMSIFAIYFGIKSLNDKEPFPRDAVTGLIMGASALIGVVMAGWYLIYILGSL